MRTSGRVCEGCTAGVGGLCGRRLVAVIGILPIGDHEELPGDGQA